MTSPSTPRLARAAAKVLSTAEPTVPQSEPARAKTIAAIEAALHARANAGRRRRWVGGFAVAAAVGLVATGAWKATRPAPVVVAMAPAPTPSVPPPPQVMHVESLSGGGGVSSGAALAIGDAVSFGQRVVVDDGTVTLLFPTTTHLSIGAASEVVVKSELVEITKGAVTVAVAKVAPKERFIVRAGDVEVEVRGTIFHVERGTACEGDVKVNVMEGRVVVRDPKAEREVGAGESWATTCPRPAEPTPSIARATPPPTASSDLVVQNSLFREAMEAKSRGDSKAALERLDALMTRYPKSALHEAASVQRMRLVAGDPARAREAAERYLQQYPSGFGRQEAERLLGH